MGKIQQFFKDMYKSLTQRNLDDNPQLEAVLKKIIFPTGEEDPDVKPATHEPVPPDKGQILAATLFKQGNDYRQAIIRGTKAADMQSFIHEMLHTTLYTLRPNELDTLAKYAGFEDGQEYLLYRELRDFNSLDDNPEMATKLKTGEDKLINEAIDAIGNNKLDSYPASIRNVFVKIKNFLLTIWHKINQQQPETQWSEDISKAFHSWILGSERDLQAYQMAVDAGMKAKAIATGTAQGPIDLALGNGQTYPTRYTAINLDELKEPFVPINYNSDIKSLAERAERVKIEANEDLILSGFPDVYQEQGDYPVPNYKQAENRFKTLKAELDALEQIDKLVGQNVRDYGVPGYRHGETEASQEYRVKGGWKLNLTVDKSKYAAVDEWLDKNTPKEYKLLTGGDEGKNDFTIYVGSKAQANALAEKIAKEIPSLLLPNASDDTYRVFNEYVKGRFDIQTSQTPTPYKYYGLNGIPFDAQGNQSSFSRALYKGQDRKLNATNTIVRIDKDLTQTFGEYYTGKSASGEELIDMAGVTRAPNVLLSATTDYEKIQNWDAKAAEVRNAEAEYTTLKAKVDAKLSDPDWINRYKNYKDLVVEMSRVTSKYNAIKEGRNQLEIEKVRNMVPKEWFNSNGTQQAINNDDLMILIHPDGRVMYDPNGVRKLLRPYQNPVKNLVFVDKGEPDLSTIGGVILRDYGLTEAQARDTYNRLKSGELTPAQVDKYYYDAGAHDFAINEYHDFKLKNMTRFGLTQEQVDDPNIVVALMPELDYETLAKTSNPGNIYDLWNISATSRTPLVLKPLINNLTEYAKTPEGQTPIANAYISEIATTMEYLPFRDVDGKTKAIIHPTASANDIIEAINAERMAPLINSLPGVLDIIEYATLNSWNSDMIYKLVTDTVSQKVKKFEKFTLKNATTGDTYSAATMRNFIAAIDQTIHAQLENSASLGKYDIHGPNINEAVRMPMSEMPDNIKYHINNSLKYFLSNTEYLIANPTPTKLIISDKPIVEPFYKNAKELSANIADGRVKLSDVQTALIDILANNYNKDNPLQQQLLRLAILDKVNTPEVSYYYRVAPYDIITKRIDQVNGRLDTLTRRLSMGIRNGLSPEAFQNEVKHIEDTIKEYQNGLTIAKEQYELINNKPTQAELTSINKNNLTDAQRQQLSRIKDTTSSDLTKAMNLKKEIARLTAGLEANKALLQSYKDTGTETEPLFYKRNVTELSEEYHRVENLYKDSKELGGLLTGYQKQTIKALLETLKARIDSIRSQRDIYDTDNGKIKTKSKLTADAKLSAARRQAALAQTELEEQTKIQSDAAKNEVMSLAREAVAAGYEGGYKPKTLNSMLDANNYKNKLAEFLKLTINLKENTGDNPFGDLFYKEDQVPDLMRAGITHNLYRLLNEIERYNANKQDPAYLPPVIRRNMILLATDDIDIR
ncbi:MAG TPA: hypothetical protein PL124_11395 [Candidatus Cloacimonadota bacterium]|nr:hypothetical protein [Candidatus Cloacimonadota bacterium]